MNAVRTIARGIGLAAFFAVPAHAAGGGSVSDLLWSMFNFALLVTLLFVVARKPIKNFFAGRKDEITTEIEEAAALKKQADERYAQWQRRLGDLESEVADIQRVARERAEAERENILTDARETAERIKRDATLAVEQEVQRARLELRGEASELAVELAAGILREQVGDGDRDRLLDEFIQRIERAPTAEN